MSLLPTDAAEQFVDLQFIVQGYAAPLDHGSDLWDAVREILPWLETDMLAGIHHLSGLSPGPGEGACYLSRRSRLTLRLARGRVAAAQALIGSQLHIAGSMIEVGAAKVRDLTYAPVLHAAFVTVGTADENAFMEACRQELAELGVSPRLICGKPQQALTPQGTLTGFSLMLHDLKANAALLLQRNGLGCERKRGCGIFVPCKTIVAVGTLE